MNLLIGFVILLCLFCSEIQTAEFATDLWTRLLMLVVVSLTVPGLALFQTRVASNRLQNTEMSDVQRQSMIRRLSTCHSAVWLCSSLAIIWAVRWQDIVRENWNLDRWPLLDEALIIAPAILSLIASWAIFFEIQNAIEPGRKPFRLTDLKNRIGFVSLRFRVYCLMVLIPISIAVLTRDLAPWINSQTVASQVTLCLFSAVFAIVGFPFLLLLIWKTERIADDRLRRELKQTCRRSRLHIFEVRVWNTGGKIVNAVVAGLLPGFRIMLLSDCLVERFPVEELRAVVRHEAGHLRLCHLPIRIGFIILPLLAMAIDEQNPVGLLNLIETSLSVAGVPAGTAIGLSCVVYAGYLFSVLPWLSHQMEYEADIYACHAQSAGRKSQFQLELSTHMIDALFRLAAFSPAQFERSTLIHPSIQRRIQMIRQFETSPELISGFSRSFRRRRWFILSLLVLICLVAIVA